MLEAAARQRNGGRRLIFLHAPPVNTKKSNQFVAEHLAESKRAAPKPKWIPKEECNLTYGTINHYLSQFYYLCVGCRESHLQDCLPDHLSKVDLILCGHAHRNIEFRIEMDNQKELRLYSDAYSQALPGNGGNSDGKTGDNELTEWWAQHRPVVAQTAACGPKGAEDVHPPYYRYVRIDQTGEIIDFSVKHL